GRAARQRAGNRGTRQRRVGPEDRDRLQPVVPGLGRPRPVTAFFRGDTEEPFTCRPIRIESVAVRGLRISGGTAVAAGQKTPAGAAAGPSPAPGAGAGRPGGRGCPARGPEGPCGYPPEPDGA